MGNLLSLAPRLPDAIKEKSYTEIALAAIDEAREMILRADAAGKPCTHVVIALVAEYMVGAELRMATQWVTSDLCSDLAAVGVMQLVSKDMFGG
jgi:hypothetical protein